MVEQTLVTNSMKQQFKTADETVMQQYKIKKVNTWGVSQTRILVLTDSNLYLFEPRLVKKAKLSRTYAIVDMAAFIKSKESQQIVICFPSAKDLHLDGLSAEQRDNLIKFAQSRYLQLAPDKTLKIYEVPNQNLKEYAYDNSNYGLLNAPDESFRQKEQEIVGPNVPLEDPDDEEERESFFERAIRNPESFHQKHRPTFKKVDGCANTVLIRDEESQTTLKVLRAEALTLDKLVIQDPSQPFVKASKTVLLDEKSSRAKRNTVEIKVDQLETRNSTGSTDRELNKSQTTKKREVFTEVGELVKDVFSRSSTAGLTKIEDFEFKNQIKKAGPGKIYLAKHHETGIYYDILSMRKDKLIQKGYINSIKK